MMAVLAVLETSSEGTEAQSQETAPPRNVNGPRVAVLQIQCKRHILTDTVQSSALCAFSDTAQSSALRHCASRSAFNSTTSFLAKHTTLHAFYTTLFPISLTFFG